MLDGLYSVQIHHLASLLPLRQPFTTVYPPFVFISKYGEGEICPFQEEDEGLLEWQILVLHLMHMWLHVHKMEDTRRSATCVLRDQ